MPCGTKNKITDKHKRRKGEYKRREFVPGGNIPRVETKKRECWKFLDWRLNSENDSRVHGQPSFAFNNRLTP